MLSVLKGLKFSTEYRCYVLVATMPEDNLQLKLKFL